MEAMSKRRTLGIVSMLFAAVSAVMTLAGLPYGGAGFAVAAGLAGLFAGMTNDGD